jgi:GDP-L-fucose synthase
MKHLNHKIYVAGHSGMVGSSIVRSLRTKGYTNILVRTHDELDLTSQSEVFAFLMEEKPDQIFLAAAKVGGIYANNVYPAQFIYENLMIETNVIHGAFKSGVTKLLFLGSSCIYPKKAQQPMKEEFLLSGYLESTNEPYAIAKIAGIKLCESYNRQYGVDYRSVMPANLYGPGDNYHHENSHVIPALIRRFHEAKESKASSVTIWGSGNPRREFLYVDDMAEASVFVMELEQKKYQSQTEIMRSHLNVGYGSDVTIKELAETISNVVGYNGEINFDVAKADGTIRKLMDSERLNNLGWQAKVSLKEGLEKTYRDYLNNSEALRR